MPVLPASRSNDIVFSSFGSRERVISFLSLPKSAPDYRRDFVGYDFYFAYFLVFCQTLYCRKDIN